MPACHFDNSGPELPPLRRNPGSDSRNSAALRVRPFEICFNAGAMAKKRRKKVEGAAARPEPVARKPKDVRAGISIVALALAIVGIGLAIDSGADASFDAPKRLICLVLVAVAAAPLFFSSWRGWLPAREDRAAWIVLWLVGIFFTI